MKRQITPSKIEIGHNDDTKGNTVIELKETHDRNKLITLSWENINVYTPSNKDGCFGKLLFCKKEIPSKLIVNNVSGIAKPGSLMAIMGASGAGKTTLLNVLNYRNRGNLKISGDVKINGVVVKSRAALSQLSGYVQQEDLFIGTLKVKEQLKFQAMLRMDKSATKEERKKRVEQLMDDLNLKKCAETLIGSPEKGIKGISGGERRRLAFATELITNPNLLFFDEPTSGLDSFMAMTIVDCMKDLVRQGKTIICTIHQPSSEVFEKFDTLCLLAEGRLAYLGPLLEAEKFFSKQGFDIPAHFNPADHYIRTLAMVPSRREECQQIIEKMCDNFEISPQMVNLKSDIAETNKMASDPDKRINLKNKINYKVNFFVQFVWLLWRSFLSMIRDPFATQIGVVQTIFIAILLGLIFLQLKYDQSGVQNMNGIMFLFLTNTSFSNMFAVLNSFPSEIPIFLREHQNGMYMVISYYLAKIFVDLPRFIILPFIFVTINYWMSNLNNDVGRFFICCAIIILVANTAIAFGSFISAVAPSANAALGLSAPLLVPLMIFSGFFLNNSTVPVYFIWLRYLSWFNYANELLVINQWDGIKNITCNSAKCAFYTGEDVINALEMKKSNYAIDFGAICILLVGFRVLSFLALLIKSFKK